MAIYPLVWGSDGAPRSATASDAIQGSFASVATFPIDNETGGTLVVGCPVYMTGTANQIDKAKADAGATRKVVGLNTASLITGTSGNAQNDGKINMNNAAWGALVDGNGGTGLTPGDELFLSNANAGKLMVGPPATAGHYIVKVGSCVSANDLDIDIDYRGVR